MNDSNTQFCLACAEDSVIHREIRAVEYRVKGEVISLDLPVVICSACGIEVLDPEFDGDPVELAFAAYRKRHNLMTPDQES